MEKNIIYQSKGVKKLNLIPNILLFIFIEIIGLMCLIDVDSHYVYGRDTSKAVVKGECEIF